MLEVLTLFFFFLSRTTPSTRMAAVHDIKSSLFFPPFPPFHSLRRRSLPSILILKNIWWLKGEKSMYPRVDIHVYVPYPRKGWVRRMKRIRNFSLWIRGIYRRDVYEIGSWKYDGAFNARVAFSLRLQPIPLESSKRSWRFGWGGGLASKKTRLSNK